MDTPRRRPLHNRTAPVPAPDAAPGERLLAAERVGPQLSTEQLAAPAPPVGTGRRPLWQAQPDDPASR